MDYLPPRNYPASAGDPRPAYPDGDKAAGIKGAIPPGRALEHPMREILACIEKSGQTPNGNDLEQLWKAIQWAVAQGVGSGGTAPSTDFSKMPVMPEVTTGSGYLAVTASPGEVLVASGGAFVHRGGNPFSTSAPAVADRTFTTAASKTYHLRWRYNGGAPAYVLRDLADPGYNPGALAEGNAAFDTTYDDMLVARVVTNSANVPTVTALRNLARLALTELVSGTEPFLNGINGSNFAVKKTFNWARRPSIFHLSCIQSRAQEGDRDTNVFAPGIDRNNGTATANAATAIPLDRYRLDAVMLLDVATTMTALFSAGA